MNLYYLRITTIILLFVFASCSTAEKTVEQPDEPEVTREAENAVPEWFDESRFGYVENDKIYSFGMASAANEKEALELAVRQSDANIRTQIDYLFEEARLELVDNNESSVDTPAFIRSLRNLIREIDLNSADVQKDTTETGEGVVIAYVLKTLTKEQVRNILRPGTQGGHNLNLLLNTEVLNSL